MEYNVEESLSYHSAVVTVHSAELEHVHVHAEAIPFP